MHLGSIKDETLVTIGKMHIESLEKPEDPLIKTVLEHSVKNYLAIQAI